MFSEDIQARLDELRSELNELRIRRSQQEMEVANIENIALRQRFQEILDGLIQEQLDKEQEVLIVFIYIWVLIKRNISSYFLFSVSVSGIISTSHVKTRNVLVNLCT